MPEAQTQISSSSIEESLMKLRQLASDLRDIMESQRDALKERGVRLPPLASNTLRDIVEQIDEISTSAGRLVKERDQFRALADTAALVNSTLDLSQVLNEVMDTIVKLTGAERGYLMLRDEGTGQLTFMVARNIDQETLDKQQFEVSRTIVEQVAQTGQAIVTTNAQADPRFSGQESVVGLQLLSILCVPLKLRDQVTGVIYADNRIQEGLFTDSDLDLLAAFSDQAAVAIQNAQLFQSVSEMKNLQDDIFASITSGVITTDVEHSVTLFNRSAEEILNVNNTRAVGARLENVLPQLDERFARFVQQVRDQEEQIRAVEFEPEVPQRGRINLSMNLSPLKSADDSMQGLAIVVNDLTEQKRREAQIAGVRRYLPPEVVDGLTSMDALRLGGTRQVVSILFGDIRGFTTYSETKSPEELVERINDAFTIAAAAIDLQEGVIDKFMGDAVMALFNPSIRPQKDHALRAVRAAVAMMVDVEASNQSKLAEDRIRFGIGVHTGEAVTGNIGSPDRLDYSALGDTVNVAKRLQEEAEASQILISEETYKLVQDHVKVNRLEAKQVKGRREAVQVYELLSVS